MTFHQVKWTTFLSLSAHICHRICLYAERAMDHRMIFKLSVSTAIHLCEFLSQEMTDLGVLRSQNWVTCANLWHDWNVCSLPVSLCPSFPDSAPDIELALQWRCNESVC